MSLPSAVIAPGSQTLGACGPVVTKAVGDPVEESWMISDENAHRPVVKTVLGPVEQTWMNSEVQLVHRNGSCHPPIIVDVTPTCCGSKSIMTARACRLSHTVHRNY
jgi:hypothetical protein